MQPDERDAGFRWDMLNAAGAIRRFIGDSDSSRFGANEQIRSAVAWQVIVLGEAARRVSREMRDATPEINWRLLLDQRNFYAHEYDAVDPGDLWAFAEIHVRQIAAVVTSLLPRIGPD